MKMKFLSVLALVACLAGSVSAGLPSLAPAKTTVKVTGDYVETRTASVFAGACHYNGEYVTTGREALLAWNLSGGTFNGVDLSGVKAMAAISCEYTLGDPTAARKSQIIIDSRVTAAQVNAMKALLQQMAGKDLGVIVSVSRAPISFIHDDGGYSVSSTGFGSFIVKHKAEAVCCIQPHMVWYFPLSPIENRRVGYTETASFTGTVSPPWMRSDEDSAFYGSISY